jgi:hypothetical protein
VEKVWGPLFSPVKANLKTFFSTLSLKAIDRFDKSFVGLLARRCTYYNLVGGANDGEPLSEA